jgi:hypothetical protein
MWLPLDQTKGYHGIRCIFSTSRCNFKPETYMFAKVGFSLTQRNAGPIPLAAGDLGRVYHVNQGLGDRAYHL